MFIFRSSAFQNSLVVSLPLHGRAYWWWWSLINSCFCMGWTVEPPSQKMIQISTGSPFWSLWPLWESNSCEVGCWPCKHGRHGAWVASPRSNLVGVSPSEQKMAGLEDMTGVNPLLYLSYYEPCCSKESKKQQLGPTNTEKYVNIEYIWIHYIYENIGKQTSHGKRGTGIGYIASRSGNTPATNELLGPLKNFQ